jgi:hypothetical protein
LETGQPESRLAYTRRWFLTPDIYLSGKNRQIRDYANDQIVRLIKKNIILLLAGFFGQIIESANAQIIAVQLNHKKANYQAFWGIRCLAMSVCRCLA